MENIDKLVESVTAEIMRRIGSGKQGKRFLVLGRDSNCEIADCLRKEFTVDVKRDVEDAHNYDFIVLPVAYLDGLAIRAQEREITDSCGESDSKRVNALDLVDVKLVSERELEDKHLSNIDCIRISKASIITPLAADILKNNNVTIERV